MNIGIEDLKIHCIIGVLPGERIKKQTISIDLHMEVDLPETFPDALSSTIDYCLLHEICKEAALKKYLLLESLGNEILTLLFAKTPATKAKITLRKKSAITQARCAYIMLEKTR